MDEREFTSVISGEVRSHYGEYVYFHPHDLPFDIGISNDIRKKITKAVISLSRLDGIASEMDESERDVFLKTFTLKESSHSSSIEGTRSTMDDLYRYEKESPVNEDRLRDAREVLNYRDALKLGLKAIAEGKGLSVNLLHEMHRILMSGVRGEKKSPGQFKTTQNALGVVGDTLETAKMVPAHPGAVEHLIDNLLEYIDSDEDPMIKIALVHYQFEVIHPYRDGNGRIGRLLIMLLLANEDILHYPVIYPSGYFDRRRGEYIDRLFGVSSKDRFEEWFDFFTDAMIEQSEESIGTINGLKAYKKKLKSMVTSKSASDVVDLLFMNPYINSRDVMEHCGISSPTANKILQSMCEQGILREVSGRKRNLLYSADGILEIMAGKRY